MKKIFILLFVCATLISTIFVTGCEDNNKIQALAAILVPLGEKAVGTYLDKLVEDGKITEYQKEKIITLYQKLKAKQSVTAESSQGSDTAEKSITASGTKE